MAAAAAVTDLDTETPFRVAADSSHSSDAASPPSPPQLSHPPPTPTSASIPPAHTVPPSLALQPNSSPLARPASQTGVPASAPLAPATHVAPASQTLAVRIAARVPPPEPRASPPSAATVANGAGPAPAVGSATVAVPGVHAAVAAREASLRVRSALTKGWRKGNKPRKSASGGRGPGFTQREVDGLLELLEVHVPVTRDEWERVRHEHVLRFPGTSRSVDSIRRKFAKSYLSRSPASDPAAPLSVRRAKHIRERMAARVLSIEDGGGDPMGAVRVDLDFDMDGRRGDDHDGEADVESDDASPTANAQQSSSELGASGALGGAAPPALDEAALPMLPPVADAGAAPANAGSTGGAVRANALPRAVRRKSGDRVGRATDGAEDLASMFKMYMLQEASRREEERRMRAEERAEQRAMEKARQEREDRRSEQFMQLMMLLASNKTREN